MRQDDTENHDGFMDSVLGKAKKVLFPEAVVDVGVVSETMQTAPSSLIANPNERRKAKSRARLASSTSMLANITSSHVAKCNGSVAMKNRAHTVCEGKENKPHKTSGKRGNNTKLDSLAVAFSSTTETQTKRLVGVDGENSKHVSKGITGKSKGKGLSYALFDVNANNEHRRPHTMRDDSVIRKSGPLRKDEICNKSDIDNTRRRGIVNNNVSSKERNESSKEKSKRYLGTSSLMMLPSSTQKVQRPMHRKKPISRRMPSDNICAGNRLPPSSNPPFLENMQTANITGAIDNLSIVEGEATCSTPHSIWPRNRLGSITSPPGFLHRLSMLSNPNLFLDHSPLPDSKLMKRFDGKKTPDNNSGSLFPLVHEVTSPFSPEATASFSPVALDDGGYNATINSIQTDEDHVCINRSSSSYSCSQQAHDINNDNIEDQLIRTESAAKIETASPCSIEQASVVETNDHREVCAATSEVPNVAPLHDRNVTTHAKDKPTKPVNQTRPRSLKQEGEASTEVRRSSRNSKPTDRLTVTTWEKKGKPVRSDNSVQNDDVNNTKREKSDVLSVKKGSVENIITKDKSIRTDKKVNGVDDIEDGAEWESYQAYIQTLLLRKNDRPIRGKIPDRC
jgi:hypothetical protein